MGIRSSDTVQEAPTVEGGKGSSNRIIARSNNAIAWSNGRAIAWSNSRVIAWSSTRAVAWSNSSAIAWSDSNIIGVRTWGYRKCRGYHVKPAETPSHASEENEQQQLNSKDKQQQRMMNVALLARNDPRVTRSWFRGYAGIIRRRHK